MSMRLALYAAMGSAMRSANGAGDGTGPIDPILAARNVTRLNGVAARFAAFTPHISPTNWHYIVPVYVGELGTVQQLLASADNSSLFHIKTDGTLKVKLDGVSAAIYLDFNTVMAKAGQINIYILKGNGSSVTVELNGVSTVQPTAAYNPPVIDYIGSKVSSDYLEGYFFDLVLDNKIYPLNSANTIHMPVGSELGPDVWRYGDNPSFVVGSYALISGSHGGFHSAPNTVFRLTATVDIDKPFWFEFGDTSSRVNFPATTGEIDFAATFPAHKFQGCCRFSSNGDGAAGSITNITMQEVPVERGQELWDGQVYEAVNEGVVTTITSGSEWSVQSDRGGAGNIYHGAGVIDFPTVVGKTYAYSVESADLVNLSVFGFNTQKIGSGQGAITFTADSVKARLYVCPRTTNTVTFSNPTIKEIASDALIAEQTAADGSDIEQWTKTDEGFVGEDLFNTTPIDGRKYGSGDDSEVTLTGTVLTNTALTTSPITYIGCILVGIPEVAVVAEFIADLPAGTIWKLEGIQITQGLNKISVSPPYLTSGRLLFSNERGHTVGDIFTASEISLTPIFNYAEQYIPTQRYMTMLDGQSKFWLRQAPWSCVNPIVEVVFLGNTDAMTYFLFDGVDGTDRAYAYINGTTGFVNTRSEGAISLNGQVIPSNTKKGEEGKFNKAVFTFTGAFRIQTLGVRFSQDSLFAPTSILSINLIDPADSSNTFEYPLDKKGVIALPDGEELGSDLVTNGDFSTDLSDWRQTSAGAWAFDGGNAKYVGSSGGFIFQTSVAPIGTLIFVSVEIKDYVSGVLHLSVGNGGDSATFSGNGVHTYAGVNTLNSTIYFRASTDASLSIDNVSFKEIPNSAYVFENGEIDGSDQLLLTPNPDGSGFIGDDGTVYDYANGVSTDAL